MLVGLFFFKILWDSANFLSLNIGMLIMRIYALYEQSRKVLALYIVIVIVMVAVGCVSLNLRESHTQSDIPLLMLC